MVAKSFQNLEQVGDVFKENGRAYVNVRTAKGTLRKVRWYSDEEYVRLYPTTPQERDTKSPYYRPLKDVLGFIDGTITIYAGDCESERDWFIANHAQFNTYWGWFFPSSVPVPDTYPSSLRPITLFWENFFFDPDHIKPASVIEELINTIKSQGSVSQYVGKVGERITVEAAVRVSKGYGSMFGLNYFNVFEDAAGNVFVWNTQTKHFKLGCKIRLTGTVKDHSIYNGEKQTILSRCKTEEIENENKN